MVISPTQPVHTVWSATHRFPHSTKMAAPAAGAAPNTRVNPQALQHNMKAMMMVKAILTVLGGLTTGVLGITGLSGFAGYAVLQALAVVVMWVKAGGDLGKFWHGSVVSLWTSALVDQLVTFILFWTLAFAVVHIYA